MRQACTRNSRARLEFDVAGSDQELVVTPPSWRATKDISIKDDLVEEVGRMIGYGSITPAVSFLAGYSVAPQEPERLFLRAVRAQMSAQGFTEVHNYSFVSEEDARVFGFDRADHVAVTNPIASDQSLLRTSLLPGIRKNLIENSKRLDSFRFFEIGREIHKRAEAPVEVRRLAAAIFARDDGAAGLFEIKRAAECLMPGCELAPCQSHPYEHPARSADVRWQGHVAGRVFELHPSLVEGRAAILYVNLETMLAFSHSEKRYTPPPR